MHRLFVDSALLREDSPVLPKDAANHLRVLRPKAGERIELFDGRGCWRAYAFAGDRSGAAPLRAAAPVRSVPAPGRQLVLFACVTKGSRWDWTIEKATELGVTRIVPVISERTIVRLPADERAAKRTRWERIAEDAARQSDAKWLPEIVDAVDFADALALVRETACFVGALTEPPSQPLLAAVDGVLGAQDEKRALAVFVGPEGDFTPEELSALVAVATPTSFGPTVLRAETAALYAIAVLAARLGA